MSRADEVAAEKNSTLVMPVPVELLRFFDRMAPAAGQALPQAEDARDSSGLLPAPEVPALIVPASRPASAALTAPLSTARKASAPV